MGTLILHLLIRRLYSFETNGFSEKSVHASLFRPFIWSYFSNHLLTQSLYIACGGNNFSLNYNYILFPFETHYCTFATIARNMLCCYEKIT
jgi:hypothetical protein